MSEERYQIFQKLPSEEAMYVETAVSLEDAKNRWKELKHMFPGDYFILDRKRSVFIVPFRE